VQASPGPAWGATLVDRRVGAARVSEGWSPWRVALEVDAARFRAEVRALLGA
jgi:hypothetical protein